MSLQWQGTRAISYARHARMRPTSRSSTSRCLRTTPMTVCWRRTRSARTVPSTAVLVLSQFLEEQYAVDLLGGRPEGVGYLLKDRVADVEGFIDAVRRVARGGSAIDPEVVGQLVGRRRRHDPIDELSCREREVVALMAEGKSNRGIAEALFVTVSAVERHVTSIFAKLGLPREEQGHRRVLAVLRYLQH